MNGETLPSDPELPGLGVASDHRQMLEILRKYLRPVPTNSSDILACRLSRVHYYQADRCTLRYTLRLVDRDTGGEQNLWVTGQICAGDRAVDIWRRLRDIDVHRKTPEAFPHFEPISFVPDLNMVVQIFPYDRHLPALLRLVARPLHELEPVFLRRFGKGKWHADKCTAEPVHYRAGRAAVLRHQVWVRTDSKSTSEKWRFYVKLYRDEDQVERTYCKLRALSDRHDARNRGLVLAKPVAFLRTLRGLAQEEVGGISLRQILLDGGNVSGAVQRAARALASFRLDEAPGLPHHDLSDEIAALRTASQILAYARPNLREQVRSIVDVVATGLGDVMPELTHRELRTDHIFLDDDQIAVVDLDSLTRADPLLDLARVLADLAGLGLRCEPFDGRWKTAAHTFQEEYFRAVPRSWRNRLPYHYAGALLKEAVDFFRHQEPRWHENVGTLINEAEQVLRRTRASVFT